MSEEKFGQRMLDFVSAAGQVSLQYANKLEPILKKDNSVITVADKKISDLGHEHLDDLLKSPEHLLIDEEHENVATLLDQNLIDKSKYIWSLDPIDGTRVYANGMPQFAISIGLIKEGRPWMGAVYFPKWNELFFCDGSSAYFAMNAFTPQEQRRDIKPIEEQITAHSVLMCDDEFLKFYDWNYTDAQIVVSGAATVDLTWPTIGRGCGGVFCASLWDLAGAWPIVEAAGMQFRHVQTGEIMEELKVEYFQKEPKPWKVRDYYIISTERNYSVIKSKLTSR